MEKKRFFYLKNTLILSSLVFLILSIPPVFASQLNQSLTYDGNGNLITGDGKYREYNEFNQLLRVYEGNSISGTILESYLYHPTEDRILIKYGDYASSTPDDAVVYVNENLEKSYTNLLRGTLRVNYTYYVFDENGLVGELVKNNTNATLRILYYHNDYSGSVSLITNSSGSVVEETFYEPFGGILIGGNASRYSYEGKEFDSLTEDYDFHFRKYNPSLMVFTQPDSVVANVYDPQTLNRYAFERNNPYKYVDEDGKNPAVIIGGVVITYAAIELVIDFISTGISTWQYIKDPKSMVNEIALIADIVDLTSGPISNPGPSGLIVHGGKSAWKNIAEHGFAKVGGQVASYEFYNIEKKYSPFYNYKAESKDIYLNKFSIFSNPIGIGFYNPLLSIESNIQQSSKDNAKSTSFQSSSKSSSNTKSVKTTSALTSSSFGKMYPGGICGITASCA